jgi:predicted small metal-binding protein
LTDADRRRRVRCPRGWSSCGRRGSPVPLERSDGPPTFEAWAETEEELMEMVALHARTAHGIEDIPTEMAEKVQAAIEEA